MGLTLEEDGGRSFEILGDGECRWLLEKHSVGRVAVTVGALPFVSPVNYAMINGTICFLAGQGTKLAAAARGTVVAFEIDAIDNGYCHGWSVLAVGEAHEVPEEEATLLQAQQSLTPWAPGKRDHLVRIIPEFFSGRRIGFARSM